MALGKTAMGERGQCFALGSHRDSKVELHPQPSAVINHSQWPALPKKPLALAALTCKCHFARHNPRADIHASAASLKISTTGRDPL